MSAFGVVRRLGLAWVRVYTSGLPTEVRQRRRGEIESDLHEHSLANSTAGDGPEEIAGAVASRFVRGVPADVSWRIAHELNAQDEHDLSASWMGRAALVLILAIAATSLVYAVLHAFGFFGEHQLYAFIQLAMMIGALVILGGFSASRAHPVRGGLQILFPGLAMAFMWAFMPPIALAMLVITAYGVYRAYRFWREQRDEPRTSRGTPA